MRLQIAMFALAVFVNQVTLAAETYCGTVTRKNIRFDFKSDDTIPGHLRSVGITVVPLSKDVDRMMPEEGASKHLCMVGTVTGFRVNGTQLVWFHVFEATNK